MRDYINAAKRQVALARLREYAKSMCITAGIGFVVIGFIVGGGYFWGRVVAHVFGGFCG